MVRALFPAFVFAAIAIAGCGGGGGGATPGTPTPGPSATASVGPSPATVTLAGGGYTLSFVVPSETTGTTATITATLTTTAPAGVVALQALQRAPKVTSTDAPLVYLTVTTTAQVGFASRPSLVFTLPSASTIPSGDNAYVFFYDPTYGTWTNWLNGTISGSTVTFTGAAGGFILKPNVQYVLALAHNVQSMPTAPPAPTPSPTPSAIAAYCSTYSSNTSAGAVPVNITDDSGLGALLIVYVTNAGNNMFMDQSGNFTQTTAYPIPAACFSTTSGSLAASKPLNIPSGVTGGRVYFAYATPAPGGAVPNPFGTALTSGPNVGYATGYPWDKIEYATTAGAVIDTTQVDALGLPLELSVTGGALPQARRQTQAFPAACPTSAPGIVGVTSCNYANIFQVMGGVSEYSKLVVTQNFNGRLIDMQIVAPKDSVSFTSFQWNLFALSSFLPSPTPTICPGSQPNGYITCLLAAYNTTLAQARLYETTGIGANNVSGHNYCATSDGTANFIFTDVGSATSCANAVPNPSPAMPVNPINMPISELAYGVPPAADGGGGCKQDILFSQPWGNASVNTSVSPGHIFAYADAFALWKDLTADINRGSMLTTTMAHPVGITTPTMGLFFGDPMFNTYAQVLHTYFNNNLAYAIAYDDLGTPTGFESGVIWNSPESFNVRINAVPAASTASGAPTPVAVPSPCANLPTGVGTF
jgi:hypothetical protein